MTEHKEAAKQDLGAAELDKRLAALREQCLEQVEYLLRLDVCDKQFASVASYARRVQALRDLYAIVADVSKQHATRAFMADSQDLLRQFTEEAASDRGISPGGAFGGFDPPRF